jgi:hypothetical protein
VAGSQPKPKNINTQNIFQMKSNLLIFLLAALSIHGFAQETQIKGFNDVQVGNLSSPINSSHGFAVGQFDLFITSRINDNTTFLAETVFEWDSDNNVWRLDVERVVARYSFTNLINVSAGKFHTPFGYWNNAYHHGALIQPTIQRPNIVRFEDEGGFLPVHQVGLLLDGVFPSKLNLSYNLMLSNGQSQGNSGGNFDHNSSMAINWAVNIEPTDGLKFVLSGLANKIPAGTVTYQQQNNKPSIPLAEDSYYQMYNASVAYFLGSLPIEMCAEYYNIANQMASVGTTRLNGFFAYIGFNKYKIIPYAVYNTIRYQDAEKFFMKDDLDGITGGLRYSISPKAIVKMEYTRETTQLLGTQDLVRAQFAIGF